MKIKISESSYVIDFLGIDYDSNKVMNAVAYELKNCLEQIEISAELYDWTLEFKLLYNNVRHLGIARKGRSDKSLKLKGVIIHIPIPTKEIIEWGVLENQLLKEIQPDKRYIDELKVEFQKFPNRFEYITNHAKRAVNVALESGITVNGYRIQLENK